MLKTYTGFSIEELESETKILLTAALATSTTESGAPFDDSDRRNFPRLPLQLPGRYMLPDRREFTCQTIDVSAGGVALRGPQTAMLGARVVAYLAQFGRVEGRVVRRGRGWFALEIANTSAKAEKLSARLEWLAQEQSLSEMERTAGAAQQVLVRKADGSEFLGDMTERANAGRGDSLETRFALHEIIRVGGLRSRVTRLFPGGIGVAFEDLAA